MVEQSAFWLMPGVGFQAQESREPGTPTPALFSKEEKRNTLLSKFITQARTLLDAQPMPALCLPHNSTLDVRMYQLTESVLADDLPAKTPPGGKPTISIRLRGRIQVGKAQAKEP